MKKNQKEKLLTNLQIVVFGLLSLLFVVLTVIELIPAKSEGIEVFQPIKVSSSSLTPVGAEIKEYHTQVDGVLINAGEETVAVEAVRVTVSDGKTERELTLEGFTLPARTKYEILNEFKGENGFDRVVEVAVVLNGNADVLPNQTTTAIGISGVAVFYAILLVGVAWLTLRAVKIRYYLYQEDCIA